MQPVHLYGEKFIFSVTARYVVHMLKLQGRYASFDKFYNLNVQIVPSSLYSKVKAIFAIWPVHLYGEKFVFSVTAWYVVHMLKLQGHYASLDKFYNLNVWIVPASLYLKVRDYAACTFVWGEIYFQCNCSICRSYVKTAGPLCFL